MRSAVHRLSIYLALVAAVSFALAYWGVVDRTTRHGQWMSPRELTFQRAIWWSELGGAAFAVTTVIALSCISLFLIPTRLSKTAARAACLGISPLSPVVAFVTVMLWFHFVVPEGRQYALADTRYVMVPGIRWGVSSFLPCS
jgi:uncharacterized membrane protein